MAAPMSPRAPLTFAKLARDFGMCVMIGVGVALVIGLGNSRALTLQNFVVSCLVSLAIFASSKLLFALLAKPLERWDGARRVLLVGVALFVSGCFGLWIVAVGMSLVFDGKVQLVSRSLLLPAGIIGAFSIGVGLSFYSFDTLRRRLADSVARVKEVEFAERELQLARVLQSRLLPPPEIEGDGYRVAARNLAARVVAGDFYDVFRLADGAVGLVVADVAGKGMAASLIMASVKAMLPLVAADRSVDETLQELNRRLAAELSPREFVALAYARFDPACGSLSLANAGLPDPYQMRSGERLFPLIAPGPRLPLGVRREVRYQSLTVSLQPGDRVLLFTDGLPEAPTAAGEPLGYAALADLLSQDGASPSPLVWLDGLLERIRRATSPSLEDDWTALVLERSGPDS